MLLQISRAGEWFLHSGIQEQNGGVARYYLVDQQRNLRLSTEITGYAVSALVYLHRLSGDARYLDRAKSAAQFLVSAWDDESGSMPFEIDPPAFTYFFDAGIIVRGLLAVWRATGEQVYLSTARSIGKAMEADFAGPGDFHPILSLPGKTPVERDDRRWSRSPGCYQLKAAMAWNDLAEATGEAHFTHAYDRLLEYSLRTWGAFLPGHNDRPRVMDRLHAFLYFLEGLLPRAGERACAQAICAGIHRAAEHLREIAPEFERCDVLAQLLRMRLFADRAGVTPLDVEAAQWEAERLAAYQTQSDDIRLDGGFYFGSAEGELLPYVNPVSTAFALQALALWESRAEGAADRHLLI